MTEIHNAEVAGEKSGLAIRSGQIRVEMKGTQRSCTASVGCSHRWLHLHVAAGRNALQRRPLALFSQH
eukprot:599289-Rhodomonas_salina.2